MARLLVSLRIFLNRGIKLYFQRKYAQAGIMRKKLFYALTFRIYLYMLKIKSLLSVGLSC